MNDVPRRGMRPSGTNTCVYAVTDDVDCSKAATWHIWWAVDDVTSSACDQHYQLALTNDWEMRDAHLFDGVCLMPGTRWQFSNVGEQGFCFLPLDMEDEMTMRTETPIAIEVSA